MLDFAASAKQKLDRILSGERMTHAYLFCGPQGVGKQHAAFAVAKAVLCQQKPAEIGVACSCISCRSMENGTHPDFYRLARSAVEEEGEIAIDEVRDMKKHFMLTASLGGRKAAVIERVELLSREAASAMLKFLEEPLGEACIIMTADRYGAVLATIRSRATKITLHTSSAEEMRGVAENAGLGGEEEAYLMQLAEGRRELFKDLLQNEKTKIVERCRKNLEELPRLTLAERFARSEEMSRSSGIRGLFFLVAAHMLRRNLRKTRDGAEKERVIKQARSLIKSEVLAAHTNTNTRLLLDALLMQF